MNKIEIFSGKINSDIRYIRMEVFVKEQGFKNEFDEIDDIAIHLLLCVDGKRAATLRYFFSKDHQLYTLGRVAVLKEYRKLHLGTLIVKEAERQMKEKGIKKIGLSAQQIAKGFYESLGYQVKGQTYLDEFCPHVWMEKDL